MTNISSLNDSQWPWEKLKKVYDMEFYGEIQSSSNVLSLQT